MRLAVPTAIVLLTAVAYLPAFDNDFVYWDDPNYVLNSELVRSDDTRLADVFTRVFLHNYHPITVLTLRWNRNVCGDCVHGISPRPFIATNIVLHVFDALLVFALARRLSGRDTLVGAICAGVFALHPMHVESVAWVSARKDVVLALFFLSGLLAYDRFAESRQTAGGPRYRWLGLAGVGFALACLSKATALVFPVVCVLIDFWRSPAESPFGALRDALSARRLVALSPLFAVSILVGLIAFDLQGGGDFLGLLSDPSPMPARNAFGAFTLLQRLHFAAYGFWAYLVRFVWPVELSPFYPYPIAQDYESSWLYDAALVACAGLLAATAWSLRRTRLIAFGMGIYLAILAPVLQFISVGVTITADRYTYLSYFGPAFLIGVWLARWTRTERRRAWIYALSGAVAVIWVAQTREQVDVWQDSDALWSRVIALYPDQIQPYMARGNHFRQMADYWLERGDEARAREYADRARADYATAQRKRALYE